MVWAGENGSGANPFVDRHLRAGLKRTNEERQRLHVAPHEASVGQLTLTSLITLLRLPVLIWQ